jgi:hypothetical protein
MKTLYTTIFIISFYFPNLVWAQINPSDIVRDWKIDAEETFGFLKSEYKNLIRATQPKKNLQQILYDLENPNKKFDPLETEIAQMKMTIEFFADGTFKSKVNELLESGSWELMENNTMLSTTNQDQVISKSTIVELSPYKLILSVKAEGEKLGFKIVFVPN